MTLVKRSVTSAVWNSVASVAKVVVLFVRYVILSRLLPVDTFGVYESATHTAVPWTAVIRPSTMVMECDEPDDRYLDIAAIAAALAANPDADLSSYCTLH